jgi:hypothetical protein
MKTAPPTTVAAALTVAAAAAAGRGAAELSQHQDQESLMFLPKQIIALKRIVSKVTSRFTHANVRIERGAEGPRAMATDGRRAVVFSWKEPPAD